MRAEQDGVGERCWRPMRPRRLQCCVRLSEDTSSSVLGTSQASKRDSVWLSGKTREGGRLCWLLSLGVHLLSAGGGGGRFLSETRQIKIIILEKQTASWFLPTHSQFLPKQPKQDCSGGLGF